jgi:hypothetical protein
LPSTKLLNGNSLNALTGVVRVLASDAMESLSESTHRIAQEQFHFIVETQLTTRAEEVAGNGQWTTFAGLPGNVTDGNITAAR